MPPERVPGSAEDWLTRAGGKLLLARQPLPQGGFWEDLCFMAQQAAELAVKAVYRQYDWRFPFVHDLGHLLDELEANTSRRISNASATHHVGPNFLGRARILNHWQ